MVPPPQIPPPSTSYDPWLKAALQKGVLRQAFSVSAVLCWLLAFFWSTWISASYSTSVTTWISTWFSFYSVTFAGMSWLLGSVPIVAAKKRFSTSSLPLASSPKSSFQQHIRNSLARQNLMVLVASSVVLGVVHLTLAKWTGGTGVSGYRSMSLWAKARNHPFHLDGRFLYFFSTQCVFAGMVWFSNVLRERYRLRLRRSSEDAGTAIVQALTVSLLSTAVLTLASTLFSLVLFALVRSVLHPAIYSLPIFRQLLRPFTAHFLKPKRTLSYLWSHFGIILFAALENFTTGLIWDVPLSVFDVLSVHPVDVCANTADPVVSMVSGITSTDEYFQFHAFNELANIATSATPVAKDIRAKIYSDAKYKPTLWESVVRQSLLVLGKDYQMLLRRGKPAPIPAPAKPEPPKPTAPIAPTIQPIRAPIFKSSRTDALSTVADAISSDGAISSALSGPSVGSKIDGDISLNVSRLVGSVVSNSKGVVNGLVAPVFEEKSPQSGNKVGVLNKLSKLGDWWSRERKDRVCCNSLPNNVVDCMIIELLCALISHSLTEDTFGVVQKDVPKILEAFVSFLVALQDYQMEFDSVIEKLAKREENISEDETITLEEAARASEHLAGTATTLRNGLASIVLTYGDRLRAFSFPSRTATKLQELADSLS